MLSISFKWSHGCGRCGYRSKRMRDSSGNEISFTTRSIHTIVMSKTNWVNSIFTVRVALSIQGMFNLIALTSHSGTMQLLKNYSFYKRLVPV